MVKEAQTVCSQMQRNWNVFRFQGKDVGDVSTYRQSQSVLLRRAKCQHFNGIG